MSGLANLAWAAVTGRMRTGGIIGHVVNPDIAGIITFMAAGEMLVDKIGVLPGRNQPLPLAGRIVLGGACGLLLGDSEGLPPATGAAIGAAAAGVSAMVTVRIRTGLDRMGLPDPLVGLAEDAVVIAVGRAAAGNSTAAEGW